MIPIQDAKDIPMNQRAGDVPQMGEAMTGWFRPMTFGVVTKADSNGFVKETKTVVDFLGVIVPTSQSLRMKAEGQRAWATDMVYCTPNLILINDDIVTYLGVQYRVLDKFNYQLYGYLGYALTQDFTGSGPT